jgi:hypothetical protein
MSAFAEDEVTVVDDDPSVSSYEDEFDFLLEGERNAADLADQTAEEDADFTMWEDDSETDDFGEFQLRLPNPEPALPLPYSVVGRKPLVDNYGATVVYTDRDSVVVEMPVLVARNPSDFVSDYWIIGQVQIDGKTIGEIQQFITSTSLAQAGPTVVFLKLLVPVETKKGELTVNVIQSADGEAREVLFSSVTAYQL